MLSFLLTLARTKLTSVPIITHHVTMTIEQNGRTMGVIKIALFGLAVPKTVENFIYFANKTPTLEDPQGYKGSIFHRVVKQFMIQGGDFISQNGLGKTSKWGGVFADENFVIPHKQFAIGMANSGKDSNGCQFYITTVDTPWLDGKHVVFGYVISGQEQLLEIEMVKVYRDKPVEDVRISEISLEEVGNYEWGEGQVV